VKGGAERELQCSLCSVSQQPDVKEGSERESRESKRVESNAFLSTTSSSCFAPTPSQRAVTRCVVALIRRQRGLPRARQALGEGARPGARRTSPICVDTRSCVSLRPKQTRARAVLKVNGDVYASPSYVRRSKCGLPNGGRAD
jgi:hypothetical protein